MTDKDMAERSGFSAAFPLASLQLCLFHTLRSFSREVTLEKMCIRVGHRDALLAIFNAMAVARSEQVERLRRDGREGDNETGARFLQLTFEKPHFKFANLLLLSEHSGLQHQT